MLFSLPQINHPPHSYQIVKDGEIIFTAGDGTLLLGDITLHPTGNGFSISWTPEKLMQGMCCSAGHTSTRFVYEDNTFTPIYEQNEMYFRVKNTR